MTRIVTYIAGKDPVEETGGGHSSYVRAHGYAAVRAGYEPHLFCISGENSVVETPYGVVHRIRSPFRGILPNIPTVGFRGTTLPFHALPIAREVERFLETGPGPHLIHGFALWNAAGIVASRRLEKKGVKTVVIANAYDTYRHEIWWKLKGCSRDHGIINRVRALRELIWELLTMGRLEKMAYKASRLVLVNYESVIRIITAQYGGGFVFRKFPYCPETAFLPSVTDSPVPVASPGIARLEPAAAPLLVTVSRHDPRKGLDIFLHALGILRREGVPFRACLVGKGKLEQPHRILVEKLGISDSVSLEGFVPTPFDYLRQADIFILPSSEEGSGSVSLLEALQAGPAVVATRIDGIPEDLTDGESALLVEPGNAESMAGALRRMIEDVELRKRLAAAGRRQYEKKFAPEVLAAALGALYTELGFQA